MRKLYIILIVMALASTASAQTAAANGFGQDATGNWHFNNGTDLIAPLAAAGFVSGHCAQLTISGGLWTWTDTGAACGSSATAVLNNAANTFTSAGTLDLRAASPTAGLGIPTATLAAPTANGFIAF